MVNQKGNQFSIAIGHSHHHSALCLPGSPWWRLVRIFHREWSRRNYPNERSTDNRPLFYRVTNNHWAFSKARRARMDRWTRCLQWMPRHVSLTTEESTFLPFANSSSSDDAFTHGSAVADASRWSDGWTLPFPLARTSHATRRSTGHGPSSDANNPRWTWSSTRWTDDAQSNAWSASTRYTSTTACCGHATTTTPWPSTWYQRLTHDPTTYATWSTR